MSQFEITVNGSTMKLTADDLAKIESAMVSATKAPDQMAFSKGSTGAISAKWLDGQGDSLKRFHRHQPPETLTDC